MRPGICEYCVCVPKRRQDDAGTESLASVLEEVGSKARTGKVEWLEPGLALLRKKATGVWTEKHRNVARKIFLEGGWTQKRLFDIFWSDISLCHTCQM